MPHRATHLTVFTWKGGTPASLHQERWWSCQCRMLHLMLGSQGKIKRIWPDFSESLSGRAFEKKDRASHAGPVDMLEVLGSSECPGEAVFCARCGSGFSPPPLSSRRCRRCSGSPAATRCSGRVFCSREGGSHPTCTGGLFDGTLLRNCLPSSRMLAIRLTFQDHGDHRSRGIHLPLLLRSMHQSSYLGRSPDQTCGEVAPRSCWKVWPAWLLGRELPLLLRNDALGLLPTSSRQAGLRLTFSSGWSSESLVPLCFVGSDLLDKEGQAFFASEPTLCHFSSLVLRHLSPSGCSSTLRRACVGLQISPSASGPCLE